MASPVAVILFASTYSVATPIHFPMETWPIIEMDGVTVTQSPAAHSALLAAAFGFQSVGSSTITVRTYDGPTGAILSEDAFDVNVKEEGVAEHDENRGRIFAGGIGTNSEGKSKFMLRVYDAETGRFLWEGQLNLLKFGEGAMTRASAVLIPNNPVIVQNAAIVQKPLQTLFSVRAVNSRTGGLVWQDQFAPGSRSRTRGKVCYMICRERCRSMNRSGIYLIWLYEPTTARPARYYGRIPSSNWTALRNLRVTQKCTPTLRQSRLGSHWFEGARSYRTALR